jgi:hypothetical protein
MFEEQNQAAAWNWADRVVRLTIVPQEANALISNRDAGRLRISGRADDVYERTLCEPFFAVAAYRFGRARKRSPSNWRRISKTAS